MTTSASERTDYFPAAFVVSLCGHALLCYVLLVRIHSPTLSPNVVYSVTLESGSTRGGITQVPQSDKKTALAPPTQVPAPEPAAQKIEPEKTGTKERVKAADPVEDAEVSLAEQREKELEKQKEEERKKAAEEKRKLEEKKKAEEKKAEERRRQEDERKKAEEKKKQAAKAAAQERAMTERGYQQAMQRYLGASTDAGGTGFGGDGRGGRGMGGGILKPPEWFIYKDKLESAVKQGWKWHQPNSQLRAAVRFKISTAGVVSDVSISQPSGNTYFDESVVRAVAKASPVPPPPPQFYEDFSYVEVEFKPE